MLFTIRLEATGQQFEARADQTLLQAFEAAGIALANSCRNGTCRTCMAHMSEGQVTYRMEWPGLLKEEKEEGWVLPCVAYAASDITLSGQAA